ncbi:MAG: penicillin-binding protein activator [Legionella sp.]|nr:penicillin-binding protein activator [Legionella sp.]
MFSRSLFVKLVILFVSVTLLSHCTKVGENSLQVKPQAATPFTLPTDAYLALSKNQSGDEKQTMLIMAAGRALYDGQWQMAKGILSQTTDLSVTQADEKNILLAKIDLAREQPQTAISQLSTVKDRNHLPAFYQGQYHEILASSYEAVGNASYAVAERIKLEHLLPDEASRLNNRRILWLSLTKLPLPELNTLAVEADEQSELQGWMKLALIPRQASGSEQSMVAQVEQWQQRYPEHPANTLLPSPLSAVKPYLHGAPRQMALLVPLSGALAGPGSAVRDGFIAAYNANNPEHNVTIRLYDTAAHDAASLYQQALAEGADYVVGPLTKNDVVKVASLEHPVPTLLLNDTETSNNSNAYRFGLSPANEARQVAAKAHKNGFSRALIIAPSGMWGDEIVTAFTAQWQQGGGEVVERLGFDNNTDLSQAVRDFLHVSEKEAHEKQFKATNPDEQIQPKRRQDFDMIFLLAYPSKARQIVPLLKYYFAGDVPVYATSSVYSGNTNTLRDRDLDGIIFCDMPWVFKNQLANKNWPEQLNSYSRLYALGMDSYTLANQFNQLLLFPAMGVNDKNGVLYLNHAQQVARVLAWGKFKGGIAEQISERI